MRIAHVAPSRERIASGVQTAVEELAAALSHRGHEVELWHVGDWSPPLGAVTVDRMRRAGIRCRRLEAHERRGPLLPIIRLPTRDATDVLHIHSVFVPSNIAVVRAWQGPVVFSPHGGFDPVSLKRSFLRKRVYSALFEKRMVRRAAVTVALTDVEARHVRAYAGNVTTAVVPNGVTPRPAHISVTPFRDSIGISNDARLALFVGRLDVRHKGLDRLVAAAAAAPSWRFVLVGPDHRGGHQRLHRMATELGTEGRLHLLGQRDAWELTEIYSAADLFVLPSRWEGLPMSLLEALANGVPALITPEVDRLVPVSSRGAGWVSAPSALGPTLEALATLPRGDWSKFATAAQALARDYDWDKVAAAYEVVYQEALERWGAASTGARVASR
jgi:glycosyltransferase involved in cell wall biosynthesis